MDYPALSRGLFISAAVDFQELWCEEWERNWSSTREKERKAPHGKKKENQDEDSGSLLSAVGLFFLLEKRV